MKRRTFLKSTLSLLSLAIGPNFLIKEQEPDWLVELKTTGRLFNKTIVLDKTFVIDDSLGDFQIHNCGFIISEKLNKKRGVWNSITIHVKSTGIYKQSITNCSIYDYRDSKPFLKNYDLYI